MIRLLSATIVLASAIVAPVSAASLSEDVWNSVVSDCLDQAEKEFPDLFKGDGAKFALSKGENGPSKDIPIKVFNACNACLAKKVDADFSASDAVAFEHGATTDGMVPAELLERIGKMRRACIQSPD